MAVDQQEWERAGKTRTTVGNLEEAEVNRHFVLQLDHQPDYQYMNL